MNKWIVLTFGIAAMVALVALFKQRTTDSQARLHQMIAEFESEFDVPQIDVHDAMKLSSDPMTLFVDVRNDSEIAVSKIPGALSVSEFRQSPESYRDRKIVAYCTIGYRSSEFVQELKTQGFENVANLRGSILSWTYANGDLVTPLGDSTRKVHVYGKDWDLVADGYTGVY